jgi:hypothetical protein
LEEEEEEEEEEPEEEDEEEVFALMGGDGLEEEEEDLPILIVCNGWNWLSFACVRMNGWLLHVRVGSYVDFSQKGIL